MANSIDIKATWANGKTLDELSKAIQERTQYLKGETTENAVTATCLNVLRSIRAATMQLGKKFAIDEGKWDIKIQTTGYTSGWAYPGKHNPKGRRVIRDGGSKAIERDDKGKRVVNVAGGYQGKRIEMSIKVYKLSIRNSHTNAKPFYETLIIAKSVEDVRKFALQRINRRVQQYRGVSKRLLGLLMKKVYAASNVPSDGPNLPYLDKLAVVKKQGNGFSSGKFGISVEDNLVDALLAVKGGESGLQTALQKAANSTVGRINSMMDKIGSFDEKIPTPFPEISKGK